jgi:hypothetical protein
MKTLWSGCGDMEHSPTKDEACLTVFRVCRLKDVLAAGLVLSRVNVIRRIPTRKAY